jgi:hypothetical protein
VNPLGIEIYFYFLGLYLPFSHILDQFYYFFMIHYLSPIFTSNFTNFYALWASFFPFFGSFFEVLGISTPPHRPYHSTNVSSSLPYSSLWSATMLCTLETGSASLLFGGFVSLFCSEFLSLFCGSIYPNFVIGL